jgi:hypothetical protein
MQFEKLNTPCEPRLSRTRTLADVAALVVLAK